MTKGGIVLAGHISRDVMIDYKGVRTEMLGGATIYAAGVLGRLAANAIIISKLPQSEAGLREELLSNPSVHWVLGESKEMTSIKNEYFTEDKERRRATLLSQADPFVMADLEVFEAPVFYFAGLFAGEIPDSFIKPLSSRHKIAIDAQGVLRRVADDKTLKLVDWPAKTELLKHVTYLKVDAAEAEVLTGFSDRGKAIRCLAEWGPSEIMLTHNAEVAVLSGNRICRAPYTNRNNSGRTGRGDTTFSSYLAWRKDHGVEESVSFAAALCSIKMESPGVFRGSIEDVLKRMRSCSVEELH